MAEPDDLFTLKNQLWVGNFQNAISEATMLNHVRDAYVFRAHLGFGNCQHVLQNTLNANNTPITLKLLATYLSGQGDNEMIELTLPSFSCMHTCQCPLWSSCTK